NYFLGLAFCKLFAAKLLDAPWLLHLDVWRHTLSAVLTQRSRPDLVGEDSAGRWHAFECKGRVSPPGSATKAKAKAQARRISTVKGAPCALHIAAITYFRGNVLNFYWCDPPGSTKARLEVPFTGEAWQYYYGPTLQVLETHQTAN